MHIANFHQTDPPTGNNAKANGELKASPEDVDASTQSRASFSALIGWKDAVADFLMQVKATREENTERFYFERLRLLSCWAEAQGIPLREFKARHLRDYLAHRADQGVSDQTRRHVLRVLRAPAKGTFPLPPTLSSLHRSKEDTL